MEITGKLIKVCQATEGTSAKGPWRKATIVFETQDQYPKTVAVDFWNSHLEEATKIPLGTICKVRFDVSSREYNSKWYTNCTGLGIEVVGAAQAVPQAQPQPNWDAPVEPLGENDDLPF